jgi:hypothetical protein
MREGLLVAAEKYSDEVWYNSLDWQYFGDCQTYYSSPKNYHIVVLVNLSKRFA